jgi:hypothetical protein
MLSKLIGLELDQKFIYFFLLSFIKWSDKIVNKVLYQANCDMQ